MTSTASRRPAIGLDYDGIIADTNRVKARWIREHLGVEVEPWRCDRTRCVPIIGASAYESMGEVVYERRSSLAAPPVAGGLDAIRDLERAYRLYVVTARRDHRVEFARRWLELQGIAGCFEAVLSSAGSTKARICIDHEITALVDDDERHLGSLTGVEPVLLKAGYTGSGEEFADLRALRSWPEVVVHLSGD